MRTFVSWLMLALLATMLLQTTTVTKSFAQQALTEEDKASVIFDLRIKKIREGKLMQAIGINDMLGKVSPDMTEGIDTTKIDRIFGAANLPQDLSVYGGEMASGPLPFNFFVRIQFTEAAAADKLFNKIKSDSGTEEINGTTYLTPPEGVKEAENVIIHKPDAKTIEAGTRSFVLQQNRRLFKKGLAAAWGKAPDHGLRVVLDMDGERALINKAVAMAKEQAPGPAKGFFTMIDMAKNLRISIDLDAKDLLVIAMTGVDDDKAEELRGGLDALLAMGKAAGGEAVGGIPDPDAGQVAKEVLDSLKATRSGAEVQIAIPRPSGMDDAVKKFAEEAKGMLEGGFGAAPDGFGEDAATPDGF